MQIVDILSQLVPDPWTALTQLSATAVLFFLMYKLAYKPVKKILDTRSEYEQSRLSEAEKLLKENQQTNDQIQQQIQQANQQAEEIIANARKQGEEAKEALIEQGKAEAARIIEQANSTVEAQRKQLMESMHQEIVEVAVTAAEKLLGSKLDKGSDIDAIDSFVKEIVNK